MKTCSEKCSKFTREKLLWKVNVPSVICKSTTKKVLGRKQYNRKTEGKRNRSYDGKKRFIVRRYARRNKLPLS